MVIFIFLDLFMNKPETKQKKNVLQNKILMLNSLSF